MPHSRLPLSGASTSIVKAAIPSCEFDLCCLGSSALAQRAGAGVSLCTDLLRDPDVCLVSCLGFSGVFV